MSYTCINENFSKIYLVKIIITRGPQGPNIVHNKRPQYTVRQHCWQIGTDNNDKAETW